MMFVTPWSLESQEVAECYQGCVAFLSLVNLDVYREEKFVTNVITELGHGVFNVDI